MVGFSSPFLHSPQLAEAVTSQSVSDEAITRTMGRCWQENGYLLCPHSAVAVSCHYQQVDRQQPRYRWWAPEFWGGGTPSDLSGRGAPIPLPQAEGTGM